MINGRPMPTQDRRNGISTVGGIAIGVGLVVLVSAALLVDELGNQSD